MFMTINDDEDVKNYRLTEEEVEIIKKFLSLKPGHTEIGDILYDHDVTIKFQTDISIIDF